MTRWFRFYDDAINDPKILKLPEASRWHWTALLCIASKHDGILPPTDDVALMLRVKPAAAAAIIAQMRQAGLLDDEDGKFSPHNWSGRQYKSDTSNERVKRYRQRKCNVTDAVTVTPPETDNRAETEQSRADVRDDTQKRVGDFAQAVVRVYAECNSTVLPETSRCTIWLSQGYDPEVCLAAIAQILVRKPSISSLSYFDQPIADAHAKKAPPRRALNNDPKPVDWDNVIAFYKRTKIWSRGAGPDPDSPACLAPPEILQKYGIQQTGV